MDSGDRSKRESRKPERFTPWEVGDSSMIGGRKAKSREKGVKISRKDILEKKRKVMKQYRDKKKSEQDNISKGEEESEEEAEGEVEGEQDDEVEDEGEGAGGGDQVKKTKEKKKITEVLVAKK